MTLADLFNAPREIVHKGKTWQLRRPDQLEQGMFQRYLEKCAYDAIERREYQDDAAKDRDRHNLNVACALGAFEWGSPATVEATANPLRLWKLIQIIARDQGMTDEIARELMDEHVRECVAAIIRENVEDPKAVAAMVMTLGFPPDFLSKNSSPHSAIHPSTSLDENSGNSTTTPCTPSTTCPETSLDTPSPSPDSTAASPTEAPPG